MLVILEDYSAAVWAGGLEGSESREVSVVGQREVMVLWGAEWQMQSRRIQYSFWGEIRQTCWLFGCGFGGERKIECSVFLAHEAGNAMYEAGPFSVNIKSIALCYKSLP